MTNLCRWHDFYEKASGPQRFGHDRSYRIAAAFLKDCATVQDWGCGACWLRQYVDDERYLGIDGSGPHAQLWMDLVDYRSECQGICLRHVLEHNDDWRAILANALASFRKRMVIVLSTGLADHDVELSFDDRIGVPDIALSRSELALQLSKFSFTIIEEPDGETFIFVSRRAAGHDKAVDRAMGHRCLTSTSV
jgi:hypothetical protein